MGKAEEHCVSPGEAEDALVLEASQILSLELLQFLFFSSIHQYHRTWQWFMLADSCCLRVSIFHQLDLNQFFGFFVFLFGKLRSMFWGTHALTQSVDINLLQINPKPTFFKLDLEWERFLVDTNQWKFMTKDCWKCWRRQSAKMFVSHGWSQQLEFCFFFKSVDSWSLLHQENSCTWLPKYG